MNSTRRRGRCSSTVSCTRRCAIPPITVSSPTRSATMAIRWTRGGQKTIESIKSARASRAVRDQDHAVEVKSKLEAKAVNLPVRAGEGGRLFGAVTVADIASALSETSGEKVDKRTIVLGNPIKALGSHQVSVKLHDDVSATVSLNVVSA